MAMVIFTKSGTFSPTTYGLAVGDVINVVCVGGGGGGGGANLWTETEYWYNNDGGGGAGGQISFLSKALTSTSSVSVTVGAGGSGGTGLLNQSGDVKPEDGGDGGSSSFGSLVTSSGGNCGASGGNYTSYKKISNGGKSENGLNDGADGSAYGVKNANINNVSSAGGGGGGGYFPGMPFFGGCGLSYTGQEVPWSFGGAGNNSGRGYGAGGRGGSFKTSDLKDGSAGNSGIVIVSW